MREIAAVVFVCLTWTASLYAQGARPRVLTVEVTAYCIEGETDSGKQTRRGIAAADPAVLPMGTVVRVSGLRGGYNGTYTVADTGRTVKGQELDLFIDDCTAAKKFGRQTARLRVVARPRGK